MVFVKGSDLCMSVSSPPPPCWLGLCFVSWVYPGNSFLLRSVLSFVSWISAMWMLRSLSTCFSSSFLFLMPLMLNCKMFSLLRSAEGACGVGA